MILEYKVFQSFDCGKQPNVLHAGECYQEAMQKFRQLSVVTKEGRLVLSQRGEILEMVGG